MDQLIESIEDWDESAKIYRLLTPRISFYRETAAKLVAGATLRSGMSIADVGAGSSGILENLILASVPAIDVMYCVDPAINMLDELRCTIRNEKVKFVNSSVEALSAQVPPVDRVLCNAAVWNFNMPKAFREIHHILQPDGEFLFTISEWDIELGRPLTHEKYALIDKELLLRGLPPKPSRGSAKKLSVGELTSDLRASGFNSISRETFFVNADEHDYELFYRIPAIAARSLPHLDIAAAVDVLIAAVKQLGHPLTPVEWMLFCARY